jgi:succinoglycan biosynthesis transport protein ExoP
MVRRLIAQTELFKDKEISGNNDYESFEAAPIAKQQKMVVNVMKRLAAKPIIGTALIEVSYRSANPIKAAKIANDIIRVYQRFEILEKDKNARQLLKFLNDRLDTLQRDLIQAETALDDARQDEEIDNKNLSDIRLIQINVLTKELANAQSRLSELLAAQSQSNQIKSTSDITDEIPSEIINQLIVGYKNELTSKHQERARLSQKYGPNHPIMIANSREIATIKRELKDESNLVKDSIKTEIQVLKGNITGLKERIIEYQNDYQSDAPSRRTIRDLEGEASAARAIYNNFMGTYREAMQGLNFQDSAIQIVSYAVPPIAPSYPQKMLIIILCAITGLFLGIFVTLILEKLHNVFQSVGQIEKLTGIPVYGILPKAKKLKSQNPSDFIIEHTGSGLAELVRSLYMSIILRDTKDRAGGRVITFTSTIPDEGKSTVATWLATIAAGNGKRVVIIDADMRRPSLHHKYDLGNARGLSDYLSDRLPLDEIIYRKHPTGVDIITSKPIPTQALTLITGDRIETMFRRLRDMYDLIIIDAPTSLIFSDARVFATLSDKTFYVVEWKKTKRDILLSSVKQFTDMGYDKMAFIMNKADIDEFAPGSAADMAYLYQSDYHKTNKGWLKRFIKQLLG